MKVPLEHEDAPVLGRYSAREFRALLTGFREIRIVEERFPVKSRLHGGWKGFAFNTMFVGTFNALPAVARQALRLASARVLPQMKLIKTHALGNDFLLVAADQLPPKAERAALAARSVRSGIEESGPTG